MTGVFLPPVPAVLFCKTSWPVSMQGRCDALAVPWINRCSRYFNCLVDNDYHSRLRSTFAFSEVNTEVVNGQIINARPN